MICATCKRSGTTIVKIHVVSRGNEQTKIVLTHQCKTCQKLSMQEIGVLELDAMVRAYQDFVEVFGI